jgi:raffinose/stachyose/melibiose transport system substrate-binding protein
MLEMKHIFKVSTIFVILAMLFAGCASPTAAPQATQPPAVPTNAPIQPTQAPAEPTSAPVQPTTAPATAAVAAPVHKLNNPVTIGFTTWRNDDVEMWKKIIAEFDKLGTNVTVEYRPVVDTEYDSVLKTQLQAGKADDIIFVRAYGAGRQLYDAGYLEEITSQTVPNIAKYADSFLSAWRTEKGVVYGLPANWVNVATLYNKKIFDQYKLTEPATWDDLLAICKTLKSNGVTPIAAGTKEIWAITVMWSAQILPEYIGGEAGRLKLVSGEILPTDQAFIDHENLMMKLRDACLPEGYQGVSYGDAQQMFASEQAAMILDGSWDIAVFEGLNEKLEMDVFPSPLLKAGDPQYSAMSPAGAFGLNAKLPADRREAALVFLNWLSTPESGKIQGDQLAGQFPCVPGTPALADPIATRMAGFQGDNGKNLTIWWHTPVISDQEPGAYSQFKVTTQAMMNGEMTPEQAAKKLLDLVASWYKPWQKN